ncbi:hypothetical protein L9F63_018850, partial [Diploptera punctata]
FSFIRSKDLILEMWVNIFMLCLSASSSSSLFHTWSSCSAHSYYEIEISPITRFKLLYCIGSHLIKMLYPGLIIT